MTDSDLIDALGGTAAVARRLRISTASVSEMRKKGIPDGRKVELGADIEQATKGAYPRWRLRPSDWQLIWPELVGAPGAPEVPAEPGSSGHTGLPLTEAELDLRIAEKAAALDRAGAEQPRQGAAYLATQGAG